MVESQPRDVNADNEESLRMLRRAIAFSQEQFSLILVRCNYGKLRQRLMAQLRELCTVNCRERVLEPSVKSLYQVIIEELREEPPSALIISGLELVDEIEALLITANNGRDEFRKNFPFPLVLWVTDAMEHKLRRVAPDFTSWAAAPIEFEVTTEELVESIEQAVEQVFAKIIEVGAGRFINNAIFNLEVGSCRWWELASALQDLQHRGVQLEPELAASLEFVLGQDANNSREDSWRHYQQSLVLFQESGGRRQEAAGRKQEAEGRRQEAEGRRQEAEGRKQERNTNPKWIERQGCVLFYMGLWWRKYAVENRTEYESSCCKARSYFQQALEVFEQHNRPDLVAKFINSLGEVLLRLKEWDELEIVAKKALKLHQRYPEPVRVAHDYDLLAEVELSKSVWIKGKEYAEQALEIITELEQSTTSGNLSEQDRFSEWLRKYIREFSLLSLGRSLSGLGEKQEAIKTLETAIISGHPQYDPSLYIQIMQELRSLYFEQGEYLKAFDIKRERQSIEQQYGFRAFIGAGRLQPKQRVINPALPDAKPQGAVTQEIAASGRQQDVNRLVERMARNDHKLTVIQGQSGVGKSSIVQAGLIPVLTHRAIDSRDVLPVLQQVYTDWVGELGKCLTDAMAQRKYIPSLQTSLEKGDINSEQTTIRQEQPSALCPLPPAFAVNSTDAILEQLHRNADHNLLTVLIFDQFEEFFFICKHPKQRRVFYEFLRDCLDIPYVKVILSLREDYLHYLLECNNRLVDLEIIRNNILDKNILYYLGNFSPADARAVIQALTEQTQFYLEPELIEQLVEDLAGELGEVRPIELQVIGAQLQTENITTLEQYRIPGSKEILVGRFLEEVVKDCGHEHEQVAKLVLYLLTDENNTRPLKTRADLELELEVKAEILDLVLEILVKSGIVLRVPASPAERYQLVHDYLVPFVRQQQSARLIAELEKEREQRKLTEAKLNEVLKQQLRDARRGLAWKVSLGAIAGGLAILLPVIWTSQNNTHISSMTGESERLLSSNQDLQALVESIKAGKRIKRFSMGVTPETKTKVVTALQDAVYSIREINSLEGHTDTVTSVNFSRDGQMVVSGSADNTVKLWSINGKNLKTFRGHTDKITQVSFSPDGKITASASADNTVKLWNSEGKETKEIATFTGHKKTITSISFSPDGKMLASGSEDDTVKLWSLDSKEDEPIITFEGHEGSVTSVSFSPDGKMIASGSEDKTVKLWNLDGKELKSLDHLYPISDVSFSPVSKASSQDLEQTIISSDLSGENLRLWRSDGSLLKQISVYGRKWNIEDQTIAVSNLSGLISNKIDLKLLQIDNQYKRTDISLQGHRNSVTSFSLSPNGKMLASASEDNTVKLWNLENSGFEIHHNSNKISFSPDGKTLASVNEGKVKLWNLEGKLIQTIKGQHSSLSFSPDGKRIASASIDNTVQLWSQDGTPQAFLENFTSIIYSKDGQTIALVKNDNTVQLFDRDGKLLTTLKGESNSINHVEFSLDGQTLATINEDQTVKIWQRDGTLLSTLEEYNDSSPPTIGLSPEGGTLAIYDKDNTVKFWRRDGTLLKTVKGYGYEGMRVSFSPDGKTLAILDRGKETKLAIWKLDGTLLKTIPVDSSDYLYFSSDGKTILIITLRRREIFSSEGDTIIIQSHGKIQFWGLDGTRFNTIEKNVEDYSPDYQIMVTRKNDRTLKLWQRDETEISTIQLKSDLLPSYSSYSSYISFSPKGKNLAIQTAENTIELWSSGGTWIKTIPVKSERFLDNDGDLKPIPISFSPNSQTLAIRTDDNKVEIWSIEGELIEIIEGRGDAITKLDFLPKSNTLLISGYDDTVKLWQTDGKELKNMPDHSNIVNSVSFSPDGQIIASVSDDKTVKLWNLDGTLIKTIEEHEDKVNDVSFSPNGQIIASASDDDTVKLWKLDGKLIDSFEGHSNGVNRVSFSSDGKLIASASKDKTVKLWSFDGTEFKEHETLDHDYPITSISFSPDGERIASATENNARLWSTDGTLLKTFERLGSSNVNLSPNPNPNPNTERIAATYLHGYYSNPKVNVWNFDLDELITRGCDWSRDYLHNNPNVSKSDRKLCD
ncbi:MAG: hypothetical protein F6K16_19415 [Symploca sp. SIO2B6]|nr:hypothetical protein [Symploca sp. SIO2B6]